MKIAVLIFWALFSSLTTAVPTGEESNNQTEKVQGCSKSDQTQCFPDGINGTVSTNLIDCLANQCICDECFTLNATSGQCTVTSPDCYFYNPGTGTCVDNRKSQLVAFLLSFFLSGFGVANFYIKRYDLAAGQLLVLLILIIGTALGICIPLCMCCCMHWRADTEAAGGCITTCFSCLVATIVTTASLVISAWWIADAVIFGLNKRLDGNDCPLKRIF